MDQNTDTTFAVLREIVAERPALVPLVKTAEVGATVREALPPSAFADPGRMLYPIHNPAQALLSRAYIEKEAGAPEEVFDRINNALQVYGVGLPGMEFRKVAEAHEQPDYLLPNTEQMPVFSDTDLKLAFDAVSRNQKKLAPATLATAATKLVKHAAARGEDLPLEAYQWAGLAQCDRDVAADWIEARGTAARHKEAGIAAYSKVAALVRSLPFTTERGDLTKLAEAVGDLDETFGLTQFYGKSLPDPLKTMFNTKIAMGEVVNIGGTPVPMATLVKQGPDFFSDVLGPDIVEEISNDGVMDPSKIKEIFPTLPSDMNKLLLKQLDLAGCDCGDGSCG